MPGNDYDIPSNIHLDDVVDPNEWSIGGPEGSYQHTATVEIPLSLSAPNIFLIKRGSVNSSNAQITASDTQAKDSATVRVHVLYNDESVLQKIKVAKVSKPDGEIGVGLFTLTGQTTDIAFVSTIILPKSPSKSVNVSTDVPDTAQKVSGVQGIEFQSLSLQGTNGSIEVEDVHNLSGTYKTTDGDIKGKFLASSSLSLATTAGTINVQVELSSAAGSAPSFDADNAKGDLIAVLNLTSSSKNAASYNINAKAVDGKVDLTFPTAPVGCSINLNSRTANGLAHTFLPPAFEGNYRVQTDSEAHKPTVTVHSDVQDPSGKGRKRTVTQDSGKNRITGVVYWGQDGSGPGNVNVQTTGGDNNLEL